MTTNPDGERLAAVEVQVTNTNEKLNSLENSVQLLHGKFDTIIKMITENYVSKETFDEFKKNKWQDRAIVVLITAIISGLVAFFLREKGV